MKVLVGRRSVSLMDRDLLAVGGEARVFRKGQRAIKIFHAPEQAATPEERRRLFAALSLKRQKLAAFPRALPQQVVAPEEQVSDRRGHVVGYSMPLIDGAEELRRLSQRTFREGLVPAQQVIALFRQLHLALEALHSHGVVVGDLNDGNLLFRSHDLFFIDADSMQFGSLPCVVGHERFLDPRLYGVDLAAGCAFDADSDWYAFAVLLFSSLLYLHPYGGTHREHGTLLRRAEARVSALRADVLRPKAALPAEVLPDELAAHFEGIFDHGRRGPFPARLLEPRWTRCGCGLEHARPACPACARQGRVAARELLRVHGRCQARRVFVGPGRVLCAAICRGRLAYLWLDDQRRLRREDGQEVPVPFENGLRLRLAAEETWIGRGAELLRVRGGCVVERAHAGTRRGRTVFAAVADRCFRGEEGWLVEHGTGRRWGQLLEGQSALWLGERLGWLSYRAGLCALTFLFRTDRPGLRPVALPPVDGSLRDELALCADDAVLYGRLLAHRGRERVELFLVDDAGRLVAQRAGHPDEARLLATLRGKALRGGRLLAATEDGLLSVSVDRKLGLLLDGALFPDTQPFVGGDVELLPGPGGTVFVVTPREINQLTLV